MKFVSMIAVSFLFQSVFSLCGEASEPSIEAAPVRINSQSLTCAQIQGSVRRNGSVILYYNNGLFERVVANQGYCDRASNLIAKPFYVPSSDFFACFAGFHCTIRDNRDITSASPAAKDRLGDDTSAGSRRFPADPKNSP